MVKKIFSKISLILVKWSRIFGTKTYMRNFTSYLRRMGAKIPVYNGDGFFAPNIMIDNSDYSLISIGGRTTIATDVIILTHDYSVRKALSRYGFNPQNKNFKILKPVSIGENVFIGARTTILPGTNIGDNVIIAAGSVVKGAIPSDEIWGGTGEVYRVSERLCDQAL